MTFGLLLKNIKKIKHDKLKKISNMEVLL